MKEYYDQQLIDNIKYLIVKKKYNQAIKEINDYKKIYPNDMVINVYLARIYRYKGDIDTAENIMNEVMNNKIHSKKMLKMAFLEFGDILLRNKKYNNALEQYNNALAFDEEKNVIFIRISNVYLEMGDYNNTLKFLDKIDIKYVKNDKSLIYLRKSEILLKIGKYDDSLKHLKLVKDEELTPNEFQKKYLYLGKIFYYLKDFNLSLEYFKKCLTTKSKIYYKAYFYIASIYKSSNVEEAIRICEEVKKQYNNDNLNILLGDLYLDKKLNEQAFNCYKEINNYMDNNYYLGKYYLYISDFNRAEYYLEKIYKKNRNRTDILHLLILTKFRLKKEAETLILCNEFMKNNNYTQNINIKYNINRVLLALKPEEYKSNNLKYSQRQILNYNEEEAIKHVEEHHCLNSNVTEFNKDLDIYEFFKQVKLLLTEDKKFITSFYDTYAIDIYGIGMGSIGNINQLRVITLPDTKNIITMYPYNGSEKINIEDEEEQKPKVKRLSQIERFNKRYGKI